MSKENQDQPEPINGCEFSSQCGLFKALKENLEDNGIKASQIDCGQKIDIFCPRHPNIHPFFATIPLKAAGAQNGTEAKILYHKASRRLHIKAAHP